MPTTPAAPRDTTRALDLALVLVGAIHALVPDQSSRLHTTGANLLIVLRDMDARTGKRDPSTRKPAKKAFRRAKSDPKRSLARKQASKASKRRASQQGEKP